VYGLAKTLSRNALRNTSAVEAGYTSSKYLSAFDNSALSTPLSGAHSSGAYRICRGVTRNSRDSGSPATSSITWRTSGSKDPLIIPGPSTGRRAGG